MGIMRSLGIQNNNEIQRFTDPQYWISYFPPHVKRDLEMMELKVYFHIISKTKMKIEGILNTVFSKIQL